MEIEAIGVSDEGRIYVLVGLGTCNPLRSCHGRRRRILVRFIPALPFYINIICSVYDEMFLMVRQERAGGRYLET